LATHWLLAQFAKTKNVAIRRYREFVKAGTDADLTEVPRVQRRLATFTLQDIMNKNPDRNTGILEAYQTGQFSGLHYSRVSRIVNSAQRKT